MLGVTLFGIFLTPVFFYVIQRFGGKAAGPQTALATAPVPALDDPWPTSAKTVEIALEKLRQSPHDSETRRRAREALKKALKELNEQLRPAENTPHR
jgi:hypothetical protein